MSQNKLTPLNFEDHKKGLTRRRELLCPPQKKMDKKRVVSCRFLLLLELKESIRKEPREKNESSFLFALACLIGHQAEDEDISKDKLLRKPSLRETQREKEREFLGIKCLRILQLGNGCRVFSSCLLSSRVCTSF